MIKNASLRSCMHITNRLNGYNNTPSNFVRRVRVLWLCCSAVDSPAMDLNGLLTAEDRIARLVDSLPVLSKDTGLDLDDSCPICLTSFDALLAEEHNNDRGVTKLSCGHIFCRKDLLEWIRNLVGLPVNEARHILNLSFQHGSCPTCRYEFLDIRPPGSDDESSDGGEYIPNEDDDEEDDIFIDGFTDADFDTEDMDVDLDDLLDRSDDDEMPIGAESEPSSEGDIGVDQDDVPVEVSVSIMGDDDSLDDSSDELQAGEPK
ncbi:hypothetical protein B0H10DRAFT_164164 [Mycena sp. CBHHK59/15]|nr:hypothetical protein B0H10DRAFT_164164 [Mycena sp. CBHHK59/15]